MYGIGAYYQTDVSQEFINNNLVGTGWSIKDAPEIHEYINTLKVGDIIYMKSYSSSSPDIIVKGIGIICDHIIISNNYVTCGRNVI